MNVNDLPIVSLRALEPEDLDTLYQIENDRTLWDVGTTNVPYSRFLLNDYLLKATGDIYTDKQVRLVVEDRHRQTVGLIDLFDFNPKHRRAEIGLVVSTARRGQGYGQAALRQLIDYARRTLHLHQLYAFVADDNEPSLALFRQTGFSTSVRLSQWLYDGKDYHDAVFAQLTL